MRFLRGRLTSLEKRLDEERANREQRRKEKEEQHLYLNVKVITETQFKAHQGFDLASWDDKEQPEEAQPKQYRMLRTASVKELVEKVVEGINRQRRMHSPTASSGKALVGKAVEDVTDVDPSNVRLWVMVNRQNKTVRPDQPLTAPEISTYIVLHYLIATNACTSNRRSRYEAQ